MLKNELSWLLVLAGVSIAGCGGRSEVDSEKGGAANSAENCPEEPSSVGCAGGGSASGGASAHAGIRTVPCSELPVTVNRDGKPVPVCHHIK